MALAFIIRRRQSYVLSYDVGVCVCVWKCNHRMGKSNWENECMCCVFFSFYFISLSFAWHLPNFLLLCSLVHVFFVFFFLLSLLFFFTLRNKWNNGERESEKNVTIENESIDDAPRRRQQQRRRRQRFRQKGVNTINSSQLYHQWYTNCDSLFLLQLACPSFSLPLPLPLPLSPSFPDLSQIMAKTECYLNVLLIDTNPNVMAS